LQDCPRMRLKLFCRRFQSQTNRSGFRCSLNWTMQHGVDHRSMLFGEFDVTRTYGRYRASDVASQEAWLRDVRTAAEPRAFRWALGGALWLWGEWPLSRRMAGQRSIQSHSGHSASRMANDGAASRWNAMIRRLIIRTIGVLLDSELLPLAMIKNVNVPITT
jgi:hypothetical protein